MISVHYRLEEPENAPVLMFDDGLATSTAMWDEQAGRFSLYIVCLLNGLGTARANYVGLSLEGMTGQRLAARHPDRSYHSSSVIPVGSSMWSIWSTGSRPKLALDDKAADRGLRRWVRGDPYGLPAQAAPFGVRPLGWTV